MGLGSGRVQKDLGADAGFGLIQPFLGRVDHVAGYAVIASYHKTSNSCFRTRPGGLTLNEIVLLHLHLQQVDQPSCQTI